MYSNVTSRLTKTLLILNLRTVKFGSDGWKTFETTYVAVFQLQAWLIGTMKGQRATTLVWCDVSWVVRALFDI